MRRIVATLDEIYGIVEGLVRTLVIGDVHGSLRALEALLDAVAPGAGDMVIGLGDFVDRGWDAKGVVERLIRLERETRFVGVMGNHEEMMLTASEALKRPGELGLPAYHDWLVHGGYETVLSYAANGRRWGRLQDVPEEHWAFLQRLVPYVETSTHLFVHAGVEAGKEMPEQEGYWLRWARFDPAATRHVSGKIVVCGHTEGATVRDAGNIICIDTAVYRGGWLSCLEMETGRIVQSSKEGAVREEWLGVRRKYE